jgi:translation initiation factor IF-3
MRMNREIDAPEIRLLGEEGEQLGVVPLAKALAMADEKELDLVEISPTAEPPVCRIMDYGKYKYEQQKKQHDLKRKTQVHEVKQLRIKTYRIDKHDLEIKVRQARAFLVEGNRVSIMLRFRSRENSYDYLGREVLNNVASLLDDVAKPDAPPLKEGSRMTMSLSPVAGASKGSQRKQARDKPDGAEAPAVAPQGAAAASDEAQPTTPPDKSGAAIDALQRLADAQGQSATESDDDESDEA